MINSQSSSRIADSKTGPIKRNKLDRNIKLWGTLIWVCLSLWVTPIRGQERPNILILFTDDQRADTIGYLGNDLIKTPNIDRIYAKGTHFDRAYCMGSIHGAVCVPSRAMLMSGRQMFATDMQLKDQVTFPELFRDSGYSTFGTGKWHNGESSFVRSFEKAGNVMLGGMSNHAEVPIRQMSGGKLGEAAKGDKFSSTLFADAAVDFLASQDGTQPFLCYVSFSAPHDPRMPPAPYDTMYRESMPPLPTNFMTQHPFNTGQMTVRDELLGAWPRTETMVREQLADYYGMISHMDFEIGRILKTLDEKQLTDNTIIVFAADHGLAMGSHGLLGKQSLYEHCMRAPVCISGPGIPEARSNDEFVYLFDLFPTVCEYAGIEAPQNIDGISLKPVIEGTKKKIRENLFTTYAGLMRSVRDDRWKLVRWPKVDRIQLFDLQNDPDELMNLADHPEHQQRVIQMMMLLTDWQKKLGDDLPLIAAERIQDQLDLNNFKRKPDRWQPKWIVEKYFEDGAE